MTNTSKTVSGFNRQTAAKVPPNFKQDYEPGFDPELDQTVRSGPSYAAVQTTRSSSSWPAVWILLILAVAGLVAYGFFGKQTVLLPSTSQNTTNVTPPAASTTTPSVATEPPAASATAPATPVEPPAATNVAPAAPAATTTP
jgi:hypothetical protein